MGGCVALILTGNCRGETGSLSTEERRGRVARGHTEPTLTSSISLTYFGIWKSTPRSSLALVVASMSSQDSGSLVARCSLKIQSVPPTIA